MSLIYLLDRLTSTKETVALVDKKSNHVLYYGDCGNIPFKFLRKDCHDIQVQNGERLVEYEEKLYTFDYLFTIE